MLSLKSRKVLLFLLAACAFVIGIFGAEPFRSFSFAVSLLAYVTFIVVQHRSLPLPYRHRWQLLMDICNVAFFIYFALWYLLPSTYNFHSWPIQLLACVPMCFFGWKVSSFRHHREERAIHGQCLDCGQTLSSEEPHCSACGAVPAPVVRCPECGQNVPEEFHRCPACRVSVVPAL